jgi:tetratricopeptide (TPR) repeat protein
VSQTLGVPGPDDWPGLRKDALILRLAPRRTASRLELGASWAWVAELRQGAAWHRFEAGGVPSQAIESLLRGLPLPERKTLAAPLVPRDPAAFWNYLAAQGGAPGAEYARARGLLEACAAAEPDCASIPFALGELEFFHALQSATNDAESLRRAEALLQRGLDLFPRHPRGTWLMARLRTDTGSAKEALELLIEARRSHPGALPLILGLTYAGRYAGLLDFAARAEGRADELSVDSRRPVRLQVTFLYRGEWDRYEKTLWIRPGDLGNSTVLLFRGQLHLARGERDKALAAFRAGSESPVGYAQFIRMARVFRLILEQDLSAARAELDALARSRVGLRVPDGEYILNMAEAYALLGDLPRAQDLAEKAFYTGFTCARWYETNPLLKPLHGTPRWDALLQHVRERQAILEARFPEGRWDL